MAAVSCGLWIPWETCHHWNPSQLWGAIGGHGSYSALREATVKYCPAIDMKPLYKLDQQRLDRLQVRDLSHAHSSDPDEGIIQFHFPPLHQIFLLALRATNTRIHLFTSIFCIQIFWGDPVIHLSMVIFFRCVCVFCYVLSLFTDS